MQWRRDSAVWRNNRRLIEREGGENGQGPGRGGYSAGAEFIAATVRPRRISSPPRWSNLINTGQRESEVSILQPTGRYHPSKPGTLSLYFDPRCRQATVRLGARASPTPRFPRRPLFCPLPSTWRERRSGQAFKLLVEISETSRMERGGLRCRQSYETN